MKFKDMNIFDIASIFQNSFNACIAYSPWHRDLHVQVKVGENYYYPLGVQVEEDGRTITLVCEE